MSAETGPALQLFVFLLGLAVGSFLNVLALRTLEGQSIVWPPSRCTACGRSLAFYDNIPLVSFIVLGGKCRHCRAPISWQYPLVELGTGLAFLILLRTFGWSWHFAGMAVFASTLMAVTVTDIREKLIPHDITYPSMLLGIAFSAVVRKDLLGALAGVGASYIIFDFLAHYGLKLYLAFYGNRFNNSTCDESADAELDEALGIPAGGESQEKLEEFEVMGGGDAVLSAVISAWLGWQRLAFALVVGFAVGTVMGMVLLINEMRKANILKDCLRPAVAGALIGFALLVLPVIGLSLVAGVPLGGLPWLVSGLLGAGGGCLLGIVSVGTRVSKPFPFGPALAAGGLAAIFWDPVGALLDGGA